MRGLSVSSIFSPPPDLCTLCSRISVTTLEEEGKSFDRDELFILKIIFLTLFDNFEKFVENDKKFITLENFFLSFFFS